MSPPLAPARWLLVIVLACTGSGRLAAEPIVLSGHQGPILFLIISPKGHWLLTGSLDKTVRLWDLTAKAPVGKVVPLGTSGPEPTLAFSPDDHWLVLEEPTSKRTSLRQTLGLKQKAALEDETTSLVLRDLTARDPQATSVVLREAERPVVFSPNGHWLATGYSGGSFRLWDLSAKDPNGAKIILRAQEPATAEPVISPDSHWMVTAAWSSTSQSSMVYLWDLTAKDPGAAPVILRGAQGNVTQIAITPNSRWLVTAGPEAKTGACLWDLTAAQTPPGAPIVLRDAMGVAISGDSRWLATRAPSGTALLLDLRAKDPAAAPIKLRGEEGDMFCVFPPGGRWLVSWGCAVWPHDAKESHQVCLWHLTAQGPAAKPVVLRGHRFYLSGVGDIPVSPDGHWLVTTAASYFGFGLPKDRNRMPPASDAYLWDLTAQDPAAAPVVLRGQIRISAFSPDGRTLVSGCDDGTVRIWPLRNLK